MKLLLAFASLLVAVSAEEYRAIVLLQGPNNRFHGNITFTQTDDGPVRVVGTVAFLTTGKHGFHVHEKGDITGGCGSTGGHFNPHKRDHGAPSDENRHVGDLGNVMADDKGVAHVDITDNELTLCSGPNNILGRGLVIHSGQDDLGKGGATDSLTTGHAGSRVACGVIGVQSPTGSWSAASSTVASVVTVVAAVSALLLRI